MPSSATRAVGPSVKEIDAAALESLEAINHRLKDGGVALLVLMVFSHVHKLHRHAPGRPAWRIGYRQDAFW